MKRKRDLIGFDTQRGIREAEEGDALKFHLCATSFAELPYHIIISILLRLPIKSVLICKCVCKSWHTIISDPHFAQLHFECLPVDVLVRTSDPKRVSRTLHLLEFEPKSIESHNLVSGNDCGHLCSCEDFLRPDCNSHMKLEVKFKLPLRDAKMVLDTMLEAKGGYKKKTYIACKPRDDKFNVVNSCNGLLCLCDPLYGDPCVICNPITGEFIQLPEAGKVERLREPFDCAFGFLKKTNEYKVIRIYNRYMRCRRYRRRTYHSTLVNIHTVGTRLWRSIEYDIHWLGLKFPTCFNGSLHWLAFNNVGITILCFNLENETFNEFSLPSPLLAINETINREHISFGELKGCLYVCFPSGGFVNLWRMMTYGEQQSWTEVLIIDTDNWKCCPYGLYQPITGFLGPGLLIYHARNGFIYYEPEKKVCRYFKVRGTRFTLEPISHIPSLISLKDAVTSDNIAVLNVHSRCASFKLREEKDALYLVRSNKADRNLI